MAPTVDRRRDQGSGSITWLNPGRTRVRLRVFVGRTEKGKPIQVSRTITVTGQREANRALDELKKEVTAGEHGGSSATLKRQLEEYVGEMPRLGRSPRTIEEARRFVNNVLPTDLGAIPINRLTGRDLDRFYKTLGEEGKSPGTVRRYHAVMSAALSQAVKWSYLERNPAARATIPKPDSDELQVPSIDEVSKLVGAAMADNPIYGTLIRLAVFTGMRRGELCGLRWSDVEPGVLRVRRAVYRLKGVTGEKAPKSGKPRPVVLAPGSTAVLEQWRSTCETRAASVGGLAPDPYVFSSFPDSSRPLNPDTVSAYVARLADRLDLDLHMHSLRHFAATELLAGRVAPNDVAKLLGHADPAFTMRRYGHATDERQAQAAAVLAGVLPASLEKGSTL